MDQELLRYSLGKGAEAFTARRDSALPYPVIQGHQVHGDRIAVINRPGLTRADLEGYDAFICKLPGVAIGVRTADCVPILLYDPVQRVVASHRSGQFPSGTGGGGQVQGCRLPHAAGLVRPRAR